MFSERMRRTQETECSMHFPMRVAVWQVVVLSAIPLLAGPLRGSAQSLPRELGFDGAISFTSREATEALPSTIIQTRNLIQNWFHT